MTCYQEIVCQRVAATTSGKRGLTPTMSAVTAVKPLSARPRALCWAYRYKAYEPGGKEALVDMAINSSGIRDTARVLGIAKGTVISTLKKRTPSPK